MKTSFSYPEGLKDLQTREQIERECIIQTQNEDLIAFKEKDHNRTEMLARHGSNSSLDFSYRESCSERCSRTFSRMCNYILERSEQDREIDREIHAQSYASFYYFIKWFIRSIFLLSFTTLGSIAGKEVGCEIKDHAICRVNLLTLAGNSPHIISTVFGFIFGLIAGQWIGKIIWNFFAKVVLQYLSLIRRSKCLLFLSSIIVYSAGSAIFGLVYYFFIYRNIIGVFIALGIGFFCALLSIYRREG